MLQYMTGQLINATHTNINEKVKLTANTGMALLDTANPNLDGAGNIQTVLIGASNGTIIKNVTIQSRDSITRGMIRFYISDNSTFTRIIDEVDVPARQQTGTQDCWSITYETEWYLKSGYYLMASTEQGEKFCVVAEGLDMSYPTSLNGL
jgi:hypothetical protein